MSRWRAERARRRRRRRRLLLAGVVVVAAIVVGSVVLGGDDGEDSPAEVAAELGRPRPVLPGFRIVYRMTLHSGDVQVQRRELSVRRPFSSRDETFNEGSAESLSVIVVTPDKVLSRQGGRAFDLGGRAPQAAAGDFRFAEMLPVLEDIGWARPLGRRTVAGRPCRRFRLGSPVGDRPARPTSKEHADLCIDGDGLVLSEEWRLDGRLVRELEAIEVVEEAAPAEVFTLPEAAPLEGAPMQVVQPLGLDEYPDVGGPYLEARPPPWGFRLTHRNRLIGFSALGGAPSIDSVAYVDTYELGARVVTVEYAQIRSGGGLAAVKGVRFVEVGALGRGKLTLEPDGPQLLFETRGWLVRVKGILDLPRLQAFAALLRPRAALTPGGGEP